MKRIKNFLDNIKNKVCESKDFVKKPSGIHTWIYMISIINFIVGTNNTFNKVGNIKKYFSENKFGDFYNLYISNVFNKVFIIISVLLIVFYLGVLLYKYFKEERKNAVFISFLVLMLLSILFAGITIWVSFNYNASSLAHSIGDIILPSSLSDGNKTSLLIAYLGLPVIFILIYLIIMSKIFDEHFFIRFMISIFIIAIGLPLLLLVVELLTLIIINIKTIIMFIIVGGILVVGFMIFSSSGGSSVSYNPSYNNKKTEKIEKKSNGPEVKEFKGDVKFVRRYSVNYSSEQIYSIAFFGENRVCSAYEYDNKKVVIKLNGKEVTFIPKEK